MFNKNYVAIACIDWLDDNVESISNTLQTVSHGQVPRPKGRGLK